MNKHCLQGKQKSKNNLNSFNMERAQGEKEKLKMPVVPFSEFTPEFS